MNSNKILREFSYLKGLYWLAKKLFWLIYTAVKYLLILSIEIAGSGNAKYSGSYYKKDYTNHSLDINNLGEDHDIQTSPLDKKDIY